MDKRPTPNRKFFAGLAFMLLVTLGCTQGVANPHTATTNMAVQGTVTATPGSTPLPSGTVPPTVFALTMTLKADKRAGKYLLPTDIDEELAQVIQLALEKRLGPRPPYRGKRFFSYALLAPPEKTADGLIKAYLYVEDRVFYVDHGELIEGGGGNVPAVVTMKKEENGWRVEVQTPEPGRKWASSIREMFPEDLWPLLFHSPPIPHKAIEANIVQQAEAHFGLKFDAARNSFPQKHSTPTPAVRILTPTPTPTLDISTLALDVSSKVYMGQEEVSIAVDLYPKVRRPFYKGLLSSGWRVEIYRCDDSSSARHALVLDRLTDSFGQYEFSVTVPLDELYTKLGNVRGFVYRVVDRAGKVSFQGEFYLQHGLKNQYQGHTQKTFPDGYQEFVNEGVIIGFPNLLDDTVSPVFLSDGDMITVQEPRGGFYELHFEYGFAKATGITGTEDLQEMSKNLIIALLPRQGDGACDPLGAMPLSGRISGVSGLLSVDFPHEWLNQKRDSPQDFCLRVADKDGNFYKEVYLRFIPYTP